jgi:uncharacterized protein (AIM24 family)
MTGLPQLLPTSAEAETFGGVTHPIDGELVPVLTVDGILWLPGYGNVFAKVLGPGEIIDIEPGGWLYKDPSVRMETVIDKLTSGLFGGFNLIVNRFTGPRRVGLQSMYIHCATAA